MKKIFFITGLFLTLLLEMKLLAQNPVKNLVFEGGGVRGIAYSGALQELEERKMLDSVERIAGTSAGAIAAVLYALGYSPHEISSKIADLNIKKFADGRGIFIGGTKRLIKYYGWYRGDRFSEWLSDIIKNKTGKENLTFKELEDLSRDDRKFKELYITGTNLSEQRLVVFCHSTYPDMEIRDAVRISISIPFFYQAVVIDEKGKLIKRKKDQRKGNVMIDGGVIANYPIKIFDYACFLGGADSSEVTNFQTLGFRLDSEEQIAYDREGKGLAPYEINKFREYIQAFYNILIENLNRQSLSVDDWKRTISISTGGIGPRVKRISSEEKEILLQNGRKGVREFLNK